MTGAGLNPILAVLASAGITVIVRLSGILGRIPFGVGQRLEDSPAGVETILLAIVLFFFTIIILLISRLRGIQSNRQCTTEARGAITSVAPTGRGDFSIRQLRESLDEIYDSYPESLVAVRLKLIQDRITAPDRAERSAVLLSGRSSLDVTTSGNALTVERILVWALPVLGFVGTAFAMARTVAGFSDALRAAEDFPGLRDELIATVVPHLSQAFDVTLIALTLTIVAFFSLALVERYQEAAIAEADEVGLLVLGKLPSPRAPGGDHAFDEALGRLTNTVAVAGHTIAEAEGEAAKRADAERAALDQLREAVETLTQAEREPRRITFIEDRMHGD